ncbi:MAG TPA: ABC transporter ATP-binding protein [Rhabdochlamydiaceae bacterium]|nr:ABC transporter ATP-binding protein [Rhabdochlamydiaceae bacterium]
MNAVSYRELIGFLWKFIRLQKWRFLGVFLLDSLAWPLDVLLWPYILSLAIGVFTHFEGDRLGAWQALQGLIFSGVALMLFIEVASRTMGFWIGRAIPKFQADIRMEMFDHVQRHSPRYFNERFAGSLANKITDMTTQAEFIIQQLFWPIFPAFVACVAGTVVLGFINPAFGWFLGLWIVIHLGTVLKFTRSVDAYEHRHGEARSSLLGKIVDSLTNNFAVNLFYRFKYEKHILLPHQNVEEQTNVQSRRYAEKMNCFTSLFFFVGNFLLLNGALIYLWLHGKITTSQVIQVFNTVWNIAGIMWMIGRSLPLVFQSFGNAKQAYSVMLDPQDMRDQAGASELKVHKGQIVFEHVSFYYGEKRLFENTQAHIQGGEKVGLVGFTGAGKSTFINLILRFFPLHKGKILIDGQDIARVTLESLRRQIALIPQDPVLFHRSLKENISYGKPEATEAEIFTAAKWAHCDEFIRNIPAGYEAKVGERGTKLSGGEKQRIAIARAMLVGAPILILDEATSSLDSVTERYIQDSLEKLMQNRTTIVIAHRLSTLSRMDRILVFDHGKIVEEGTHASLRNKQGLYARMWNMQVGGFLPEIYPN